MALLAALFMLHILALGMLVGRATYESELWRDREAELLFRGEQYVRAIQLFKARYTRAPGSVEELVEKKCLRRAYTDPMSRDGSWLWVMQSTRQGQAASLIRVPEALAPALKTSHVWVGVCSSSDQEGYRLYRERKIYAEWAFFPDPDPKKKLPDIPLVRP